MNITEHEMRGLLAGKCLPGDMRLNEELPVYLVRKFTELKESRDAHMQAEMTWEKSMMAAIGEDGVGCVVRAIAELKAERDALAAENAILLDVIEAVRGVANNSDGISGWHRNGEVAGWDEILPEIEDIQTPATDAFLNSVRAEGVEAFAHQQRVIADATPAAAFQRDRRFAAGLAEDFAAQLRAGKDGE